MSGVAVEPGVTVAVEPGLQADERLVDRAWLRIGAGLAVAAQAMVFSLAVNLTPADGVGYWIVHGGLILSAFAVLAFLGHDLLSAAWQALKERRVSIDLLFLVTLLGALIGSLVSTFTQTGSVYYEVVAVLVVVHTTGRMLGARSRLAALRVADETRARFDRCEVLLPDGRLETRTPATVLSGERVIVAPGGAIAVDGTVVAGRSFVQETSMTGEWRPVSRGPGDRVLAGTYAMDGRLEIAAEGGTRRLDGILSALAAARLAPSELQRQADRLMAWFLPVVVTVSAGTMLVWWFYAPWHEALFHAMAVLLVACPCALGLATPVAVWGGLARLGQLGVVARTGDFLAALARCDTVCLDKTGTLSDDALVVIGWTEAPGWTSSQGEWLRRAVAAAERDLPSPVARALTDGVAGEPVAVSTQRIEPGLGVVASVQDEAGRWRELRVGEPGLHSRPAELPPAAGKMIYVTVDGDFAAAIELGERWRDGRDEALAGLQALGLAVEVLTGDPYPPRGLPVPVASGLTPAGKAERVRALQAAGRSVLFVGDGVNDVAAMSEAAVAIALRGGSALSGAAAMAVFAGTDLRFLPQAIRLARSVVGGVRGNLVFAASYNLAGMALAAAGLLHPVVAALLMVGSSALVAVRALRSSARVP